ncbi:MAG TPA: hypothetical protein PL103_07770, partial [Saccharofermentans sp.]|nr:hypothetical protein [Saccharofermentans sp.]
RDRLLIKRRFRERYNPYRWSRDRDEVSSNYENHYESSSTKDASDVLHFQFQNITCVEEPFVSATGKDV